MIENIKAGERITQAVLLRLQKVGNSLPTEVCLPEGRWKITAEKSSSSRLTGIL